MIYQTTIRKATRDDLDTLIRLRLDFLYEEKGSLTPEEEEKILFQLNSYFPRELDQRCIAYLAEREHITVAAAFLVVGERPAGPAFVTGKTATLLNVFTYPPYRRQGIAAMVLQAILEEAARLNISFIDLAATATGKPLYEKLGFTERKSKYTDMRLQL